MVYVVRSITNRGNSGRGTKLETAQPRYDHIGVKTRRIRRTATSCANNRRKRRVSRVGVTRVRVCMSARMAAMIDPVALVAIRSNPGSWALVIELFAFRRARSRGGAAHARLNRMPSSYARSLKSARSLDHRI